MDIKTDQKIIKLLKVSELRHHIADTNLGPVQVMLRFGEDKYHIVHDSTPLDDGTPEGKEKEQTMLKLLGLNGSTD